MAQPDREPALFSLEWLFGRRRPDLADIAMIPLYAAVVAVLIAVQ